MTKEFARVLRREIRLRLREMRDGCPDCMVSRGWCPEHYLEAIALVTSPKKHIHIDGKTLKVKL